MNPDGEDAARAELRDFYAIALEILRDDAAADLVRTTSAIIGLRRIEQEFPAIAERIARHVEDYGWVRERTQQAGPWTAKDILDRLQVVVLRWSAEAIEPLAARGPAGDRVAQASAEPHAAATVLSGMTACRGRAVGPVRLILDASDLHRLQVGDVLVTAASTTDMVGGNTVFPTRGGGPNAIEKALAVVADEGGLLSHGAIVCRERGIPSVFGTESATGSLHDGDVVEVDATKANGTVLRLE